MLQTPQRVTDAVSDYVEQTEPAQAKPVRTDETQGSTALGGLMSITAPHVMGYKKGKPSKGKGKGKKKGK